MTKVARERLSLSFGMSVLLALLSATVPLGAIDRYPEDFSRAIQAQDLKEWKKSVELLRKALEMQPEDGARVRIYGMKYRDYLPHFYLGLAFYKQGKCGQALEAWDKSQDIGIVQGKAEYDDLRKYRAECKKKQELAVP